MQGEKNFCLYICCLIYMYILSQIFNLIIYEGDLLEILRVRAT